MQEKVKIEYSNEVKSKATEIFGKDIIKLMEAIVALDNIENFNALIFLNEPFSPSILTGLAFSVNHCIDTTSGIPELDTQLLEHVSDEDKLKEIKGALSSIAGIIDAMNKVYKGLANFAETLIDLEKEIKGENAL